MAKTRLAVLVAVTVCLCAPSAAWANGDPASDYLLSQNLFLPFTTKIDNGAVKRLDGVLLEANRQGFRIRVAVILSPSDLGTAFSLFAKPQKYSEFLGLELTFVYRGRLLVVMPTGYGYSVKGDPDPKAAAVLKNVPPPGPNATAEVGAAIVAVQRLAASAGHRIVVPKGGGGSASRDRITIAAAVTAGIAFAAALVLYRRRERQGHT